MDFKTLGLKNEIVKGLELEGINVPTKVQELTIPKIIENANMVVQSETGSGKTLAYLLPIYQRQTPDLKGMQVIALVPTHELAMQVHHQVERLSQNSGIALKSMVIFGNVNINKQIEKLRANPEIIVGTSGRILELIKKKKISAHTIKTVIIDEADKMLDKDNIEGVKAILKSVMRDTQVVMCSASISESTLKQVETIVNKAEIIKTTGTYKIPENIEHIYIVCDPQKKMETLRKLIHIINPKRALVFINKAEEIEVATSKLQYHKLSAACIYGKSDKEDRKRALVDFTTGKLQVLIASDIAARGLHIDGVSVVFSLSIPEDPMDYLHRAGRTGRGDEAGLSVLIVTPQELPLLEKYQKVFKIEIAEKQMHEGKIVAKANGKKPIPIYVNKTRKKQ